MPSSEDASTRRAKERIGSVLRGKWKIERLLGIGGMAAVYAGTHRNGKRGAIKVLHRELAVDPDAKSRFLHEGWVANRLDHPSAVSVLDDDVAEDGSVFLVMELLEGRSVDTVASERPGYRLAPAEALNIVDQLLDVLAAAHEKGIVHRDLKPENLFLTPGGVVKVLDFGIARVREAGQKTESAGAQGGDPRSAHATQLGNAMGTPAFMPPEQALGNWDQVDARSDLWAAGATLFTLLTGRQVHEAPNINQLMLAAMTRPAPPIRRVMPELPEAIGAVVDRALAFEQGRRWQSAREMQRAIRDVGRTLPGFTDAPGYASGPSGAPGETPVSGSASPSLLGATLLRDSTVRPRSNARRIGAGIAAVVVVGSLVAFVALRGAPQSSPASGAASTAAARPPGEEPVVTPAVTAEPSAPTTAVNTPADSSGAPDAAPAPAAATASAEVPAASAAPGGSSRPAPASTKTGSSPGKNKDPFLTWD